MSTVQIRRRWLLRETPAELQIIHRHAARERVLFAAAQAELKRGSLPSQRLLFPLVSDVGEAPAAALERCAEVTGRLGFDVRRAGPGSAAVHAVPRLFAAAAPERLLQALLERLDAAATAEPLEPSLGALACCAAWPDGAEISAAAAAELLLALDQLEPDAGRHCPHGKIVAAAIPWSELERR